MKTGIQASFRKRSFQLEKDARHLNALKRVSGNAGIEQVQDYRIVKLIGEGAMSRVYLAHRIESSEDIVLKILDLKRTQHEVTMKRFKREAELISSLKSRFVIRIYEHGFSGKFAFISMEYLPRGDLKQRLLFGSLKLHLALKYMFHLAYGLAAIHGVGVIHRDLKPANLMFRRDDTLVLADFGISKRVEGEEADPDLTMVGQVLGTPHYMSPEQGQGLSVDKRTDLYSAGVIMYELLTGNKPFIARTPSAIIYQHIHNDIPKLPPGLHRFQPIINRLLAKEPDYRYQSASEWIRAMKNAIGMRSGRR